MHSGDLKKVKEGEVITKLFSTMGRVIKRFLSWAWNLDGEDVFEICVGSTIIILAACAMIGVVGLLGLIVFATFTINPLWALAWIPGLFAGILVEIQFVKAIMWAVEDFF
jgi:hypothetical protein